MRVIQPAFTISEKAYAGIASGQYVRIGGVVRSISDGRIVEHLKDVATVKTAITNSANKTALSTTVSNGLPIGKTALISGCVGFGVAALTGLGFWAWKHFKKRSEEKKQEETDTYKEYLDEYITNIQTQNLSLRSIKNVFDFFDHFSNGDLSIEITDEELKVLRDIIVRYTIKLCETNDIVIKNKIPLQDKSTSRKDLLQEIKYATKIQEQVYLLERNDMKQRV